ncbi:MAG: hypothetical protein L3J45_09860 [Flavobacteriaceae bacterium]|nr:hypothetical protein [Flavobacteriaceae bacterium]
MKKVIIAAFLILSFGSMVGQSNTEIAGVYLKKANKNYINLETELALINFNKAIKLLDTITKSKIARLGVLIHSELRNYKEAHKYAKQYFLLVKNKRTEDYQKVLELYVDVKDELDRQLAEEKKLEVERLAKEKEAKRLDSLELAWKNKAMAMAVKADSIYPFDKHNLALFKNGDFFGILNDMGVVLVKADEYKAAFHFDGYFILMNKSKNPTKIYTYNGTTLQGHKLPDISEFNPLSTHYGQVMLPRGNNKLIAYPNNTLKVLLYDLVTKKFVSIPNEKSLFKQLEKKKAISNYNKDGKVKVNKRWVYFGGILGGGISPLYNADYSLFGFLCAIDGRLLSSSIYNYIGSFYNDKLQVLTNGEIFWVNQNGTKVTAPVDENGIYKGASKIEKSELGHYLFYQIIDGKKMIVSGDKKLLNQDSFIKSN